MSEEFETTAGGGGVIEERRRECAWVESTDLPRPALTQAESLALRPPNLPPPAPLERYCYDTSDPPPFDFENLGLVVDLMRERYFPTTPNHSLPHCYLIRMQSRQNQSSGTNPTSLGVDTFATPAVYQRYSVDDAHTVEVHTRSDCYSSAMAHEQKRCLLHHSVKLLQPLR